MFARRTNPSVDPPILRKKISYAEAEVAAFRAYWVDDADPRKGIICREWIRSERKLPEAERTTYCPVEIGLKFIPPKMERNPLIPRVLIASVLNAAQNWDWSHDQARNHVA